MTIHIKNNIEDSSIGNIIASIARGEIDTYTLKRPVNYLIVTSLVRKLYPEENIQYSDGTIHVKVESKNISIEFLDDSIVFHI